MLGLRFKSSTPCGGAKTTTTQSLPIIQQRQNMEAITHQSVREARPAAQQVFVTPELVEIILFELSFRDLLVSAQRVNRTLNGVINRSQTIQKALFFLPDLNQINPRPCPLLRGSSNTKFVDRRVEDWTQVQRDLVKQGKREFLNQWVEDTDLKIYNRDTASSARKEAVAREEASWRKMLTIQPPIKEGHIDNGKGWVASDDWLRMGDLHKNLLPCRHIAVGKNGIGNFHVQHISQG